MKLIKLLLALIVWVLAVIGIIYVDKIYSSDKLAVKASDLLINMDYDKAMNSVNKAIEMNPNEPSYYRTRALIDLAFYVQEKNQSDASGFKKKAYEDVIKALELNPDNLVTERNMVPLFYFLAVKDVAAAAGKNNQDPNFIEIASNYFNSLKNKYSDDAGVITLVSGYERKLGLTENYEKSKEMIRNLRPDLLEWHESFN